MQKRRWYSHLSRLLSWNTRYTLPIRNINSFYKTAFDLLRNRSGLPKPPFTQASFYFHICTLAMWSLLSNGRKEKTRTMSHYRELLVSRRLVSGKAEMWIMTSSKFSLYWLQTMQTWFNHRIKGTTYIFSEGVFPWMWQWGKTAMLRFDKSLQPATLKSSCKTGRNCVSQEKYTKRRSRNIQSRLPTRPERVFAMLRLKQSWQPTDKNDWLTKRKKKNANH